MCLDVFIADFVESYQVTCTKHIFKEHVVFHFKCSNTIEDQILENVSVVMEIIEGTEAFAEVLTVPLGTMPLGQFGSTFVSYERAQVWISFLRTRPQDVNLFCNAGTLSSC
jgi:coatomer protein complex subunit gamma|tara:strand:+ start:110 stop:442 length:333 start_codon:yes stop_codon:yes gene_type:complete